MTKLCLKLFTRNAKLDEHPSWRVIWKKLQTGSFFIDLHFSKISFCSSHYGMIFQKHYWCTEVVLFCNLPFYYSNLPNKRTSTLTEFWEKTLIDVSQLFLASENYFDWLTWFLVLLRTEHQESRQSIEWVVTLGSFQWYGLDGCGNALPFIPSNQA